MLKATVQLISVMRAHASSVHAPAPVKIPPPLPVATLPTNRQFVKMGSARLELAKPPPIVGNTC